MAHDLGEPVERGGPGHAVAEVVPQVVRADVADPRQRRVLREQIPECPRGERPAAPPGREQAGRVRRQRRQPGTAGRPRGAVERDLPVLIPLFPLRPSRMALSGAGRLISPAYCKVRDTQPVLNNGMPMASRGCRHSSFGSKADNAWSTQTRTGRGHDLPPARHRAILQPGTRSPPGHSESPLKLCSASWVRHL